ncbi:hypothetical protein [Azospirillum sp. ST 5-10]
MTVPLPTSAAPHPTRRAVVAGYLVPPLVIPVVLLLAVVLYAFIGAPAG